MRVYIHTGLPSVDNGARNPLTLYFDLAKVLEAYAVPGQYYGWDILEIPDENWPIARELLIEAMMLYRMADQRPLGPWENIQTERVRQRFEGVV